MPARGLDCSCYPVMTGARLGPRDEAEPPHKQACAVQNETGQVIPTIRIQTSTFSGRKFNVDFGIARIANHIMPGADLKTAIRSRRAFHLASRSCC